MVGVRSCFITPIMTLSVRLMTASLITMLAALSYCRSPANRSPKYCHALFLQSVSIISEIDDPGDLTCRVGM
jgi:hypothetical protein